MRFARFFPDLATTEEAVNCHHNYVARENTTAPTSG